MDTKLITLTVSRAIDAYEQSARLGDRSGREYAVGVVDALVAAGIIPECKVSDYQRNIIETLYAFRRQLRGESWVCH